MMFCEYIVAAIVGVTVGKTNTAGEAINLAAQRVLIAFVCFLRHFVGPSGLGAHRRIIPSGHPIEIHVSRRRVQLALEFRDRIHDTSPCG